MHTVTLVREKETKRTYRYLEDGDGAQMIYIDKAIAERLGERITLTLAPAATAALQVAA